MFKFFKEKCPVCKMVLKSGTNYPEAEGKKFCSEKRREEYRQKIIKMQSGGGKSCCG